MSAETWNIAAAILTALGGGGAIVVAFSSWLGKIWAERLMSKEKAKLEQELAELRARLEKANEESLSKLRNDLEIYRATYLKEHTDKLAIYRLATEVVSDFLADLHSARFGQKPADNFLDRFNRGRLKAHGYLAMLAPQNVMDAYDSLIDCIFFALEKKQPVDYAAEWNEIRKLAYTLLNAIREDVGIDKSKVEYRGRR